MPDGCRCRKFVIANVIGAAIWAVGISLLGYWLGKSIDIDKWIYPIIAVIIVLSLIPPFLEYRKHKRTQAARNVNRREFGRVVWHLTHAGSSASY